MQEDNFELIRNEVGKAKQRYRLKQKIRKIRNKLEGISILNTQKALIDQFNIEIADLGNGCWEHYHFQPEIQTRQYRSPETILRNHYDYTADLWSLACMIFELLTGDFIFDPVKVENVPKNENHLQQVVEIIKNFPKRFSLSGLKSSKYV